MSEGAFIAVEFSPRDRTERNDHVPNRTFNPSAREAFMDIKIAFTSQDFVRDPARAFSVTSDLMTRLRIAHRPAHLERRPIRIPHGFIPMPAGFHAEQLNDAQRRHYTVRELRGETYLLESGPLEQSPYYQWRVQMLEDGLDEADCELEALGMHVAIHENAFTFNLSFITLHVGGKPFGTFTGSLIPDFGGAAYFPSSGIEERTGLWGPLVHMQVVECLAALKRETVLSLYIRDPTAYLETGDAFALLEAMNVAGYTYDAFSRWIGLELPEIQDKQQFLPVLEGAVGSAERIAQLEAFLFTQGTAPVDIDDLLARGR
jgi:hypothetical protein